MPALRKLVIGSGIGLVGLFVVVISLFGILGNYDELGAHFCSNPHPYPVCGSIVWLIVEFVAIGFVGVAMVVAGLYLATRYEGGKIWSTVMRIETVRHLDTGPYHKQARLAAYSRGLWSSLNHITFDTVPDVGFWNDGEDYLSILQNTNPCA